jgi:predicted dehydrogenase
VAAGKDVYCEKPVCHTIDEGDAMVRAIEASTRVVQTGLASRPHARRTSRTRRCAQAGACDGTRP